MIVDVIAGARPNFMKVAALFAVASDFPTLQLRLIHTGQHYDENMSGVFLQELELPQPAYYLGAGSGGHTAQTASIMTRYDKVVDGSPPGMVVVVGDVNSTLACSLVAAKRHIPVAHVEAGLRSFDRSMPEEINRVMTDSISSLLFVTESSGVVRSRPRRSHRREHSSRRTRHDRYLISNAKKGCVTSLFQILGLI